MNRKILITCTFFLLLALAGCDTTEKHVEGPFLTKYSKLYFQDSGKLVTGTVKQYYEQAPKTLKTTTKYLKGVKHGEYRTYYENGQLATNGTFTGGKLDGVYEEFWNNGTLNGKAIYSMGVIESDEHFHPNGQLRREVTFKKGLRSGEVITYYSNGNVAIEEFYIDGKLDGNRKDYYENGSLRLTQRYKLGKPEGEPLCNTNISNRFSKFCLGGELDAWDIE